MKWGVVKENELVSPIWVAQVASQQDRCRKATPEMRLRGICYLRICVDFSLALSPTSTQPHRLSRPLPLSFLSFNRRDSASEPISIGLRSRCQLFALIFVLHFLERCIKSRNERFHACGLGDIFR